MPRLSSFQSELHLTQSALNKLEDKLKITTWEQFLQTDTYTLSAVGEISLNVSLQIKKFLAKTRLID